MPAAFIHSADELVIVDVPAEQIEPSSGVTRLTPERLSELRELALLLAAQVVEEQLQRYVNC